MLDAWVIEEVRRRERETPQPPLYPPGPEPAGYGEPEPEASPPPGERGVVVIDL